VLIFIVSGIKKGDFMIFRISTFPVLASVVKKSRGVKDAADVIELFRINRVTGKLFLFDEGVGLLQGVVDGDRHHLRGGNHHLFCRNVGEFEDVLQDLFFGGLEHPMFPSLLDQHLHLFFGHIGPFGEGLSGRRASTPRRC